MSDSKLRSLVLDGCPMFAPAYMGGKRVLRMLSLHVHGLLLLTAVSAISKSVGRGCAPSSSAHVRWGEHGAPVQGRELRSLLHLGDAEELYKACYPNLISDPQPSGPVFLIRPPHSLIWTALKFRRPFGSEFEIAYSG